MNGERIRGLLGLAVRARQASLGMDACRILIRSGRCAVLFLDEGTGANTRKRCEELCGQSGTPMEVLPEGLISAATGKSNMVMAVCRGNIADGLLMAAAEQCIRGEADPKDTVNH